MAKTIKDIVHYNIDEITKKDADINIIWGERSNGKSYQVKHKKAILKYLDSVKKILINHIGLC